jgi:adenine deaminase
MPTRFDSAALDVAARRRLIRVARREEPADLILRNARLLNVYTGEILPGTDIAIAGERFAVVGDASGCAGPATELVDLEGRFVSPGFVDAHYHIESAHLTPLRHAEVTLPQGTTTIVIDPHEACASGGIEAIRYLLEASEGLPQKVYVQISSATPPSAVETVGAWIGGPEAEKALAWPRVVGLGEVMDPQRVFNGDERIWELLEFALANNQVIEGHGGYLGYDLDAYAAIGVQDSHSPRTADQALEMLRRGFEIQLKVKRSTAIVERFLEVGIDWGRVGLAVDDRPVDELVEIGGIDNELREAIRLGVPTVAAYRMATLNNARHWHHERDHGGIAPGRFADVVVLSDLESVAIDAVYPSGRGRATADWSGR